MFEVRPRCCGKTLRLPTVAAMLFLVLFAAIMPLSPGRASAADTGTVYLHLHSCPARSEPGLPSDYQTLYSMCQETTPYYNSSLITEGNFLGGQQIPGDALGLYWDNVPMHIFSIQGQVTGYDNEPVVFCQNGNGETSGDIDPMVVGPASTWAVHPTMGASGYVVCDWFAASNQTVQSEDTGSVTMEVHLCQDSFDLANADTSAIFTNCPGAQPGIQFEVASNLNPAQDQGTGDVEVRGIYWQYLNADFIQITQTTTDGFASPRVFCRGVVKGGSNFPTAEIPATGFIFAYNLLAGEQLTCDWYMVKLEQGGQQQDQPVQPDAPTTPTAGSNQAVVVINTHDCPEDFANAYQASEDDLAASCQGQTDGTVFTIDAKQGDQPLKQSTGDGQPGAVNFDAVPSDLNYEIAEKIPDGFGSGRVFCQSTLPNNGTPDPYAEMTVYFGNTLPYNLRDGEMLACDWFNIPASVAENAGAAVVTVNERLCPQGYDLKGMDAATLAANCTATQNGVLFVLVDPGYNALAQATGASVDSAVRWDGLGAGQMLITEPLPGGVAGQHAAFCSVAPQGANDPLFIKKMPIVNGTIHATVNGGEAVNCTWYDVS